MTAKSLLRNRDFMSLWFGQSVSELGSQVSLLAIPLVAVITLHASTFQVGALEAVQSAPFLLFGLPAGAIVDWLSMRKVMIVADALRLLTLGSIPIAHGFGVLTLGQLYAVAFVTGILTVFFDVAYQSYLPTLIDREQLTDGNSKLVSTQQVAQIGGPAIGGVLVSAVGAATAVVADAASYLVSVLSLLNIRALGLSPKGRQGPLFKQLKSDVGEGLRFVFHEPMLRMIAGCTGSSNLMSSLQFSVLTVFMVRRLHLTPAEIGGLLAVGAVAGLAGAVSASRIIKRINLGRAIILGAALSSVGGVCLPLATRGAGSLFIALGVGVFWFFAVVYNIGQVSLRQAICPGHLLGRMNATMRFLVWGTLPIGSLIGGALGADLGLRTTIWIGGIAGFVSPLFVVLSPVRQLKEIPPQVDDSPEPPVVPDVQPSPDGPLPHIPPAG